MLNVRIVSDKNPTMKKLATFKDCETAVLALASVLTFKTKLEVRLG